MFILCPYSVRRCFGKYCDAAFAFDIIGVHYPFGNLLIFTEGAALLEHFIYKRCFAVVDMGDYGYVSYILSYHLSAPL